MSFFKEIDVKEFTLNPFDLKNKWMLVTAAKKDGSVNTMTASWGGFGVMWNKEVVFVVIRPHRFTREFLEDTHSFSLTFFDESYKMSLAYLGKVSGRDENKMANKNLVPAFDNEIPYFKECETAIFAKNLYIQETKGECFLEQRLCEAWYPEKDFHILYIAEIKKILVKQQG